MQLRCTTLASLFAFTTLFFSACQSASTPTPAEPLPAEIPALQTPAAAAETTAAPPAAKTSTAPEELRRTVGDQTAILAFNQEFDMLNPLYAQNLSSQIVYGIWNCSAWDFDDQENALPVLVKQIPTVKDGGVSTDGREITFRLRDDIAWSDGEPITSKDFQFTYQMIADPQNNVLNLTPYDLIEAVSAPDPQTVVVRFKEPNNAWLYSLWKVLLPAHILEPEFSAQGSIQEAPWNFTPGVGCGPFVFESEVEGESVTFKTNEKYWRDYPLIGKILVKFFPDDASKAQAIINGQADLSIFLVDSTTQVPIMKAANMQILAVNSGYREGFFYFLNPTNGHPALQDVRVRQAIAMAVDRAAIIQNLYAGDRKTAISYWDETPYIDPGLKPWAYDPEKAKSLLDEAGWVDSNANGSRDKDGVELILTYGTTTSEVRQAVQLEIQKYLAAIGVSVTPSNYDSAVFFADLGQGGPAATGQLDIFQYAARTLNYPEPGTNDFLCDHIPSQELPDGENWSYLCDQELDALFKQQSAEIDVEQRQLTFHTISKTIFEKAYFVGLWNDPDFWVANPRLKNVQLSGITPFFNILEWEIQPDF